MANDQLWYNLGKTRFRPSYCHGAELSDVQDVFLFCLANNK